MKIKKILIFAIMISMFSSCGIYSFTGASISPDVKSVSILYFQNNAQMVQPSLSRKFTEALRDKFTGQSTLTSVTSNGDLNLEGEIIGYYIEPVAVSTDQKASMQRLKVTVRVRFTNNKDPKQNFEESFTRYADYDSRMQLNQVEDGLIDEINEQLTDDIFNKAVVNW